MFFLKAQSNEPSGGINKISMPQLRFPLLTLFVPALLITGCSSLHFNNSEAGLLESGQIWAQNNCSKHINLNDYQECIDQVDKNYSDAKYKLKINGNK